MRSRWHSDQSSLVYVMPYYLFCMHNTIDFQLKRGFENFVKIDYF